jgi:hypothetical protein
MTVDDIRVERLALNETLFRDVNKLIEKEQAAHQDDRATFVCECSEISCQLRLSITLDEYKDVRADPVRFMLYPGHEVPEIEIVVGGDPPRYVVVEKLGPGRDVARSN